LALIEQLSRLHRRVRRWPTCATARRSLPWRMNRRTLQVAEAETQIAAIRAEVDRLTLLVGDPEQLVDQRGWLPRDRRELMLTIFSSRRSVEVRELLRVRHASWRTFGGQACAGIWRPRSDPSSSHGSPGRLRPRGEANKQRLNRRYRHCPDHRHSRLAQLGMRTWKTSCVRGDRARRDGATSRTRRSRQRLDRARAASLEWSCSLLRGIG
jgi:hypothetical protein